MNIIAIIPARYNSTRLPGKPLIDINGKTMIRRVYEGAKSCVGISRIIVATDDQRIVEEVQHFGGEAIITSGHYENGTARAVEVAKEIAADYVLIIQGDEPMIYGEALQDMINNLTKDIETYSFMQVLEEGVDEEKRAKVITDLNGYAMTFSRSRIPYNYNEPHPIYYKGVGVYAFKKEFLLKYSELPMGPIEKAEGIELLRILENGYKIKMIEMNRFIYCVDTVEDLEKVKEKFTDGFTNQL